MGTVRLSELTCRDKTFFLRYSYIVLKMPGGKREVTGSGTNSQGNDFTSYDSGFYYKNANGSRYFNDGSGHGFYKSPPGGTASSGGQPYQSHFKPDGTSTTTFKK